MKEQLTLFNKTEYKTINTIQYLGSKKELLNWIIPHIESITEPGEVIVDLFAGTGAVGYALQDRNVVYSNDIQRYSHTINKALLVSSSDFDFENIAKMINEDYHTNYNKLDFVLSTLLETEEEFLLNKNLQPYTDYKYWCENTPFFSGMTIEHECFSSLKNLIININENKKSMYCMFTSYYSNAYFGLKQCLQIDSLKYAIDNLPKEIQDICLTALMSVMSLTVNSTTHFAQFLKINNQKSYEEIAKKRSRDIKDLFMTKLAALLQELNHPKTYKHTVFNHDYKDFFNDSIVTSTNPKLIYADPPYFKEHYSRYYHIIESLILYDYPTLTYNPRLDSVTIGRYSEERLVSDFGKRSLAPKAFEYLVRNSAELNSNLYISYSDNSIVDLSTLMEICNKFYKVVSVEQHKFTHSKQGRKKTCQVLEYLIKCQI